MADANNCNPLLRHLDVPNKNDPPESQLQQQPATNQQILQPTKKNSSHRQQRADQLHGRWIRPNVLHSRLLAIDEAKRIAIKLYSYRTNNADKNITLVGTFITENPNFFGPIIERDPHFKIMLAHMFVLRFGVRVREVHWLKKIKEWNEEDNERVGRAMAPIMRMVQTGDAAVGGLRSHYPQLDTLFDEVEGFEEFMNVIATNLLRDNKYGMFFRVW